MDTMNKSYLDQQSKKLTTRLIDRRQFILSMLAAGIALPTAISMAGEAMAATPKKGGKIRIGIGHGSTTDSLDPSTFENGFSTGVGFLYGNHLTEVDNKGKLVPDLAASISPSDDGKVWYFELRKGVEF
ncbi:MAG: peptide ABC transporter substrate-binding protein, partial [Alphaproteobacteria bacterium]